MENPNAKVFGFLFCVVFSADYLQLGKCNRYLNTHFVLPPLSRPFAKTKEAFSYGQFISGAAILGNG